MLHKLQSIDNSCFERVFQLFSFFSLHYPFFNFTQRVGCVCFTISPINNWKNSPIERSFQVREKNLITLPLTGTNFRHHFLPVKAISISIWMSSYDSHSQFWDRNFSSRVEGLMIMSEYFFYPSEMFQSWGEIFIVRSSFSQ